jgi:UDP-N-acetylglucosamine 2-epimerase (non-hydrolysing)
MPNKIHLIAAARPNFMKIAPVYHALKKESWAEPIIVHTGQHYDVNMSDTFFKDLALPAPHIHLGIGSGSHAEQTGKVMIAYEKLLMDKPPDLVIVVGDVNSTVACTLTAVKLGIQVAHLEAGLRSFDRTMPEEINRIVTDALADLLWTPSPDGDENLLREGVVKEKIERVGNVMIDSLEMMRPVIEKEKAVKKYGLNGSKYGLVTLHRPFNVDIFANLERLCHSLVRISKTIPLIFPIHPRTRKSLKTNDLLPILENCESIKLDEPVSYIPFMNLVFGSSLVITDSGGLQEETTYLGIPCLTLRPNTERPITIQQGTNRLCSIKNLERYVDDVLNNGFKKGEVPALWDGKTASRVVTSAMNLLGV